MHLEVDIRIFECDFRNASELFLAFISVKNVCWKWRWKSLKNMITYRTCIQNTYSTHRYIRDHLSIFLLVQKSLPEPPGTLEDDAKFVLTLGGVPVLKSGWFIPSFLLEKEWQTCGTESLIDLILPPGYPLSDNNWTGGLKWALILVLSSSFSSTFLVLIFCFLTIYSWLMNIAPLRRRRGERDRWICEKGRDQDPGQPLSWTNRISYPSLLGGIFVMGPTTGMLTSLLLSYCNSLNTVPGT